jgi:hypothetical protein
MASKTWSEFLLNTLDCDVNMSYLCFKTFVRELLLNQQNSDFLLADADHANYDFSCIEAALHL